MRQIKIPDNLNKYLSVLSKGATVQFAPSIAKGMLIEFLRKRPVNVNTAIKLVEEKEDIWGSVGDYYQELGRRLSKQVGTIDWLTPEWVIDALKVDYPAVASLFLGWRKANTWLKRQIKTIKKELSPEMGA